MSPGRPVEPPPVLDAEAVLEVVALPVLPAPVEPAVLPAVELADELVKLALLALLVEVLPVEEALPDPEAVPDEPELPAELLLVELLLVELLLVELPEEEALL